MQKIKRWNYEIFVSEKDDGSFNPKNREDIFSDIVVPLQLHGNKVFLMMDEYYSDNIDADGIVTSLEETPIAVKLADCNGIVLMWEKYFWVLHAGWRGLKDGIIENCVWKLNSLGENPSDLVAFVGPSIRNCCYEVWDEFKEFFDKKYLSKKWKKLYMNMLAYIEDIFKKLGISNIDIHADCTKCSWKFFSYRWGDEKKRFLVGVKKNS